MTAQVNVHADKKRSFRWESGCLNEILGRIFFARRAVFFSLSGGQPLNHNNRMVIQPQWGLSAESEKPNQLCVLGDSSTAGGENIYK